MDEHVVSLVNDTVSVTATTTPSVTSIMGSPGRKAKAPSNKSELPPFDLTDDEPLLMENPTRFVLFPIEHHDVFTMAKNAVSVFWTVEEVDLAKDTKDWEKLDQNTQHFIKHILGFFAASDGILMENLALNFQHEVQWPEAKYF